ncbi:enhanced serine sensitivity protein SseB C-terminal domain-containing protein [Hyphobacterium sp. HN65]|uniref:Enhanced serine sensitivity protein SseB C-terminal domain-containing protein n=1 Tax=Hyphobacterium lacteum TaxID=3116575 RepID=A0ABU7LLT3_9PROT|nr:enhanced serine sensitivity protein SseB C-terminal domain-containing protein [Hyphobacterium sp. HN65]MEE2524886.1 enhanced serine sensitivity protein SseB C-terminal domain-containing protein [Hyphobacterium sp. HN65]
MDDFPRNDLERALQLAATDPAARADFLEMLLESRIYVLGHANSPASGDEITISAGDTLSLANWTHEDGQSYIPFFTSLEALQQSISGESGYLSFKARELFDTTRGSHLFLNPGQDFGKEFLPGEVDNLLDHGTSTPVETRVHRAETPVQLGEPKEYPVELVEGLTRLFARHGAIQRAYIALMQDSSADQPFSLLVGLELDGNVDLERIGLGHICAEYAPQGLPVDAMIMRPDDDGPSRYFREASDPFYERSWGQRLKSFLIHG